jgi:tetratricopeptide (TPR) repeat protein
VTSRDQLVGLIAAEGAHPLTVGLLTQAEARDLLIRRLGAGRVAGEPDAVDQIITRCARLPLALAMVAARAAVHHDFALDVLAEELHQARGLDALTAGDPASDLRAAFSWSYSALSHDAAWLFRLLSLHPGPDLALPAAASLAGLPAGDVRPLLAELTGAHLIAEHVPGRYGFHDLLRAYAAEQAHAADSQAERQAAVHRLLDHYLHTAHTGTLLLNPARDPMTLAAPQPGVTVTRLAGLDQAMAWLSAEHPGLVAIVEHAAAAGFDTHTWQLAWTLTTFLHRRGHWRDRVATHIAALAAADRLANKEAQARMHQGLANAYTQLGELEDALTHLWRALKLLTELSDHTGQANVHLNLAFVFERQGRRGQVLRHSREAIELYWTVGNRTGQARALNELGWHHALRGNYGQAWTYCEQALDLLRELNDRHGQAGALDSLGYIHHHTGDHGQAIACYRHSLDLLRDTGDRPHQAELLARLGETHHAAGDPGAARDTWTRALAILDEIGHPDADQVRTQLRLLGGERPARP